jgi:hypothetical protein
MSYVKPYTYLTSAILDAANQSSNDDSAKKYINQGIMLGDYATNKMDFDQLQAGELEAIASGYRLLSGEVLGQANGTDKIDRAYFTSHIKNGRQAAATPVIYQTLAETGQTIYLAHPGSVLITLGMTIVSEKNNIISSARWDSKAILRYKQVGTNNWIDIEGTRAYSFEETTSNGAGVLSPTDKDPWGGGYTADYGQGYALRRWIGWTWIVQPLQAGSYQFCYSVNSKVEEGFSSARSFTCEIFY